MQLTPNVKKLIFKKMALIMIPPGTKNGFATGAEAIIKPGNLKSVGKEAMEWVAAALNAVRSAGEPNPFKFATDEEISKHLIEQIEAKQKKKI